MGFWNDPPRPLINNLAYAATLFTTRLFLMFYLQVRIHHMGRVPKTGGVIYCANHQSHLDPMCLGCIIPRKVNYLAKKNLFNPLVAWWWHLIDMIPIDRSRGASAMKEVLRRLKKNESIVLFPEGTRSIDGQLKEFKPGILALAKRVNSPLQPIGIGGTFECWPSGQRFPKPGFVHIVFGEPIPPEDFQHLEEAEILNLLRDRIAVCLKEANYRVNESYYDRTA